MIELIGYTALGFSILAFAGVVGIIAASFACFAANNLDTLLKVIEVQAKALERECCCTGEKNYDGAEIKCDACDALSESAQLLSKVGKK